MNAVFYISAVVALAATLMVVTRLNAVHALLYLVVSLLAVALMFFALGAHFAAVLEVIVYAGAIMVLFVFVVMILNLGASAAAAERRLLSGRMWIGPVILAAVLFVEVVYVALGAKARITASGMMSPREVSLALFGPYLVGVELASLMLLAGLVGAYRLGRRERPPKTGDE